jgi:hypothetical protein
LAEPDGQRGGQPAEAQNGIGLGPGRQGDKSTPAQGQPPCPFLAKQGSPEAGQARANQNLCFHFIANHLFFQSITKQRTKKCEFFKISA